jgi:hypothetical protein
LLRDFMSGFDFIRMRPDRSVVKSGGRRAGSVRALVEPGQAYAIYLRREISTAPYWLRLVGRGAALILHPDPLVVDLPSGAWALDWIDPPTGQALKHESFNHPGGPRSLAQPAWREDVALRIKRQ